MYHVCTLLDVLPGNSDLDALPLADIPVVTHNLWESISYSPLYYS